MLYYTEYLFYFISSLKTIQIPFLESYYTLYKFIFISAASFTLILFILFITLILYILYLILIFI